MVFKLFALFVFLHLSCFMKVMSTFHTNATPLWGWDLIQSTAIYDPGIPHPRLQTAIVYSSCGNNGQIDGKTYAENNRIEASISVGFACPHMLMYSPDMLLATKHDGLDKEFLYAVVGADKDYDCGRCYQVAPIDPELTRDSSLGNHQLIVQVVNSGYDVLPGHFDIFMAAGGFGYYTSCNKDCITQFCAGGPCYQGMYDSTFEDWNPVPNCYAGGIRVGNLTVKDLDLFNVCDRITGKVSDYKSEVLWQSCFQSNRQFYHQNFISSDALPIRCPDSFVQLTGLRRSDEQDLPSAHIENHHSVHCRGSRIDHHYCITTMQDCCMPSCAWNSKGIPDPVWNRVDSCKEDGTIWNYGRL